MDRDGVWGGLKEGPAQERQAERLGRGLVARTNRGARSCGGAEPARPEPKPARIPAGCRAASGRSATWHRVGPGLHGKSRRGRADPMGLGVRGPRPPRAAAASLRAGELLPGPAARAKPPSLDLLPWAGSEPDCQPLGSSCFSGCLPSSEI